MEYEILLSKLRDAGWHPQIFGSLNIENKLYQVRILTENQNVFEPSILYLTSTDRMPSVDAKGAFTLFCYGQTIDFSLYKDSSYNITFFGEHISQAELFNFALENLTEVQQITTGMHLLVNSLFSGNGLQYIVDTATHIFGNPIYVVDLQNKYLAISSGIIPENEFFKAELRSGYISETGILSIRANRLDEHARSTKTAFYYINEVVNYGMLVDAVYIHGIEIGHVMMLESEHSFRDFDADFFHRFSQLISMELQKDSAYSRNKGVMYSYFLADLLKNSEANISQVRERLANLGYTLQKYLYILVIPSSLYHHSNARFEIIIQQLQTILVSSIYVVYEDSIVFLINKKDRNGISGYESERLSDFLMTNQLKAGLSNVFENLTDAQYFYKQAVTAASLGIQFHNPDPICSYSDYYLYEMFELYKKTNSQLRFLIHPGLIQLYNYDQERHSDLILTLREYLKYPGFPSKVAANLHIHKNTLLYRMGKIREITGCLLECGKDYMTFNISIIIMDYLHII